MKRHLVIILFVLLTVASMDKAFARIIYSETSGDWSNTSTWNGGIVPVTMDTVVIESSHTVTNSANLYSNGTYMFLVIVGTLDLGSTGKLSFSAGSSVIIETGGIILGTSNGAQISIGGGSPEYKGMFQGQIDGPAWVSNGHTPTDGEGFPPFYTPGSIPLPVKLASFTVTVEDNLVVLKWVTLMEENFDKFIIERSSSGVDFQPIAEIKGKGRNIFDIETNYSSEDKSPLIGFNYYRLKAIDLDGAYEYFGVRVVKVTGPKQLYVYPNPSSGKSISFGINYNPSERDQILLINNLGVELVRVPVKETKSSISFDSELSPGVYILKYISSDFELISRVMVSY